MNLSQPFILRPVATTLLTIGLALAGMVAFTLLPVSPLPQVDSPTILVQGQLPGASPEVVATSLATPLERHLGQIADVTEMTSQSSVGATRIILQFGLDRDIDGAARDVEAAINAAHADLPADLKSNPTYRKVNPADAPILILGLTSKTLTQGQLYDSAATVLEQKLSQIDGVGQVTVGGSSLPAVRVELNPGQIFKYGIGLEDLRAALAAANANSPKGSIEKGGQHYQLYTNDQARTAAQYQNLVVAYRNGNPVFLHDIGEVDDSVEDLRNLGLLNGNPAVLVIISRSPGANIISTVDRVLAALPDLQASIPADIDMKVALDRTTTIRASLKDVEFTLMLSIFLVIAVVFVFLRNPRGSLVPLVAVPVSLLGTFGVMYLLNYSLDNLSLMALTIATGFVVDDAIVVMENIARHVEEGVPPMQAAIQGAREVGFTVLSMSVSLVAVFVPLLLMGGIVGRMFREFAVVLSVAVLVSLVVSLTTTPMMCARLVRPENHEDRIALFRWSERAFAWMLAGYERSLTWALNRGPLIICILIITILLNGYLIWILPKGLFPQQDSGGIIGSVQADQSISFQLMKQKMQAFVNIVKGEPEVSTVVGFTGAGANGTNTGFMYVTLKPLSERSLTGDQVIGKLRGKLAKVPGASAYLQTTQDLRIGGRQSQAQYQYTLQADNLDDLRTWAPKMLAALKKNSNLVDVNSDQQDAGLETDLVIDRPTASRLNLTTSQIDQTLYDAFGQREVSVIYNPLNQYHVVMEVAPQYWQSPETLHDLYVSTSGGTVSGTESTNAVAGTVVLTTPAATTAASNAAAIASDVARNANSNAIANAGKGSASSGAAVSTSSEVMVPLDAFSKFGPGKTPLAVNHQGLFASATLSFNLPPGKSLSDATVAIERTAQQIGMPASITGSFQGTAKAFKDSIASQPYLITAALLTIYIVLGILYESYIHPITILSTLPSAGVGAMLALKIFNIEFSLIALIGVFLLIGIVKKNAIMMIDFALSAERKEGLESRDAIYKACVLRFRPIMMTTCAALFGALPLAIGFGTGAELRRPLGISVVGGLILSQMLTLYTTPVVYLYFDRMRLRFAGGRSPMREALA
jgi:multidrug efflux pump